VPLSPAIRVQDNDEIETAFESQCLFVTRLRTQKLLFLDDAILPLNGQIPVTVFVLHNSLVAELQLVLVAASKQVSWNALPA
jgi:hypothetical protein